MLNMNRVTLLGNAGRDPDIRALKKGGRAASFSLATTEKWKNRKGESAENTEWHRIVVYGMSVDAVEAKLRKGGAVLVEGRLATRGYRDQGGNERSVTEIVVSGPQGLVNVLGDRRDAPPEGEANVPEDPRA